MALRPLHSYITKYPFQLRYCNSLSRLLSSSTTLASTTTMSSAFTPLFSCSLKKCSQILSKVRELLTSMSEMPMIASLLSSSTPKQVGAFIFSSLIQHRSIPQDRMWLRRSSLVLSPPSAVTKVVGTPSRLQTSAMLRPTPPQLVRHTPLQLWQSQNLPSVTFTSKSTADPPSTTTLPFLSSPCLPSRTTAPYQGFLLQKLKTEGEDYLWMLDRWRAICEPIDAFLLMRLMLAFTLTPPEYSCTFLSRKGVVAAPLMPCSCAYFSARLMAASITAPSPDSSAGTPTSTPFCRLSCFLTASTLAISGMESSVKGDYMPEEGEKKAGKNLLPQVITGTPSVSRNSRVRGMSRMFFTPADTTATGVLPSSRRSALTSMVSTQSLCTPPSPPVTNTSMPASALQIMVPATVVEPRPFCASTNGMSLRLTFRADLDCASYSILASVSPTQIWPCISATVAGTAPPCLTTPSTQSAHCLLLGQGMPCEIIVDSRATTGLWCLSALRTSGEILSRSLAMDIQIEYTNVIQVIWDDHSHVLADDLLVEQSFGGSGHVHLPHDPHQLADRLEPLYLSPQVADLGHLALVELRALLLDAPELLQVADQVVVDDLADLLVLGGVVHELLAVLLDHVLQLLQLGIRLAIIGRRLRGGLPVVVVVQRFAGVVGLEGVAEVDRHLLVLVLHLVHSVQLSRLGLWGRLRFGGLGRWVHHWTGLLRYGLFVVDFLLVFIVFEALEVLLLEVALDLGRGAEFAGQFIVGIEVGVALVDFGDDLEVGGDFILGGGVELILDDAEQPLVEFEQGVDLVLMRAAHLLQLLQLLLA